MATSKEDIDDNDQGERAERAEKTRKSGQKRDKDGHRLGEKWSAFMMENIYTSRVSVNLPGYGIVERVSWHDQKGFLDPNPMVWIYLKFIRIARK